MISFVKKMEDYLRRQRQYSITIETASGCGSRGNIYIEAAYEKMKEAHSKLSPELRAEKPLPKLHVCDDDGFFGFASGMGRPFYKR